MASEEADENKSAQVSRQNSLQDAENLTSNSSKFIIDFHREAFIENANYDQRVQ